MFDLRKNTPVTPEVLVLQRDWDVFFGKGFLQNIQLVRAPSVSMRSYVGTKLVLDFRIKKIIRASGLQTRSIFNRVQVRVKEIFASPSSSSSSKNFIFRVRVQVRSPGLCRSQWHEQINDMQLFYW